MPIISKVGKRSTKVRLVYGVIFLILTIGTVTMLYPFMLMLSGSFKSEADINRVTLWPKYWFDDLALFQKYAESKYNVLLENVEMAWGEYVPAWYKIQKPPKEDFELLEEFLAWREQCPWWILGNVGQPTGKVMLPISARKFRELMFKRFGGDLDPFAKQMGLPIKSWSDLWPPVQGVFRYPPQRTELMGAFLNFAEKQPIRNRIITNVDGRFWQVQLVSKYTRNIEQYNRAHGTNYSSYDEVFLTRRVPAGGLARKDWEEFVRRSVKMPFACLRLRPELQDNFHRFLTMQYENNIEEYNKDHEVRYSSFDEIPLSPTLPEDRMEQIDWGNFLKNPEYCPVDGIEVYGPRQAFEEFVAKRRGVPVEEIKPLRLPIAAADWHDCMAHKGEERWEFTTRNYKQVFGYIGLHGRGIRNTIIYCSLAIGLALLVNPLAAYALSRFKPPSTYKILLLCMATMAFPAEVTMIPAFLLLKRFPLWPLLGGGAAFGLSVWIFSKVLKNLPEMWRMIIAVGVGIVVGAWVIPRAMGTPHTSLLNTFAALVLPGMANGYMIFLLKGFFDSIPRELYEAADLDGAGEIRKFWSFTMALSTPILAVLALNAFTLAYSQFMMALIIIPDQRMWTLMVWIFQLQSQSHQAVVYASLVIGAIPTFFVFVFCQGIIMRGIVVPTEK